MNSMRLVIAIICLIAPLSAGAQVIEQQIAKCSTIKGDLSRLNCFDELSKSMHLNKPQAVGGKATGSGMWVTSTTKNPVDDTVTASAHLPAKSGQTRFGTPVTLVLRCESGKTDAYIVWGDFLGSEEPINVLTRIGTQPALTSEWSESSNNEATFFPGDATEFIKELLAVDSFVAQVTPYDENPITAEFDLHGIKNAVQPIRDTCNW